MRKTHASEPLWPTPSLAIRSSNPLEPNREKMRVSVVCSPNGALAHPATGCSELAAVSPNWQSYLLCALSSFLTQSHYGGAAKRSAGDITFILTSYFIVHGYLRDVGQHVANLQRSVNEMEEMVSLQSEPLGVADRLDAEPLRVRNGGIVFDRVSFAYGRQLKPLFTDFSLRIKPGERIGLVGYSGSGKTTLVKLLHRLYDVSDGRILIDGQDISLVRQDSLRAQVAMVPQDPILFHRSLAENIAYGRPEASRRDIERAASLAHAHDFITAQQKGYATLVGERGVKLSGGERQRVALARAFLADAPILILDEATSSLDSESEAAIQDSMERLMVGRTSIVIAHRLSTVRMLDRILVFDRGRIVEEGSHDSLLQRLGGNYQRLFQKQVLGLISDPVQKVD